MIIIMRFGENNVLCPKYIDIYEFGGVWGDVHITPYIFCLLFTNMEKVEEHDLYLNQIIHYFYLKKNRMMNNKNLTKRGAQAARLLFLYEVSIVLIDFIAMLITPGIFLMQIVTTKMYLIHFYCKNKIKCIFSKVGF